MCRGLQVPVNTIETLSRQVYYRKLFLLWLIFQRNFIINKLRCLIIINWKIHWNKMIIF